MIMLDPQMKDFVDQLRSAGTMIDFMAIGAKGARELAANRPMPGAGPELRRVEDLTIALDHGTMPARLYVPDEEPCGLLVYLHGGGWVLGNIAGYDPTLRHFAQRARCAVLSLEYRLAPEHPFPAATEDGYAGVCWAAAHLADLGLAPTLPIAVGGDSAGGNLAAVCALIARDDRASVIAAQLLIYPVVDADLTTASYSEHEETLPLSGQAMRWFWDQYIADPAGRNHPHASPLQAESLVALPPAVVALAGYDPLLDEGKAYASRLREAGVPVTELHYPGLTHGFFQFSEMLPVASKALDEIADAFRATLLAIK